MTEADPLTRVYQHSPDVVFRKVAGEFILVPIRRRSQEAEYLYTLNEVGGRVWELIDGRRTAGEIRDAIVEQYDVQPGQATADVLELLAQLDKVHAVKAV
jgi:hypothetical protein